MNEKPQKEAEYAALFQRVQLEALHGALRTLESHVAALESESARQSADLSRLDEQINWLHTEAGMVRPGSQETTATKVSDRPSPSAGETMAVRRRTKLPDNFTPSDLGEDWEAYLRNVERYIGDHVIDVARDPLVQMLPKSAAGEMRRRFDAEFGRAPWNRWDYGAVALAVLVGAMTDYLLVATPGGSFKGQPQRGSPLTAWMKEQSKRLAPMAGADNVERNAFQQWIAKLTTAAERWAKVPYDVVSPKLGLTPNAHRLGALGHDPLLGLVLGVGDIVSGTCSFIDKSGAWRIIDTPGHECTSNVVEAVVKVVVHGFSDIFTPKGLPPPFLAPFQFVDAKSGFTLKEGGDPVSVRDVARYMYSNGYDLRHFMTMKISPAIAEVVLWAYHGARACATGLEPSRAGIPDRLKRDQMLALTHALLASANVLKISLYGWNPMALNLAQFEVLARRMLSLVKLSAERDRLIRQRLEDGWEALLADARQLGR